MSCNGDCKQGRECDCGEEYPYLTMAIYVIVFVFTASCVGYLFGSWR